MSKPPTDKAPCLTVDKWMSIPDGCYPYDYKDPTIHDANEHVVKVGLGAASTYEKRALKLDDILKGTVSNQSKKLFYKACIRELNSRRLSIMDEACKAAGITDYAKQVLANLIRENPAYGKDGKLNLDDPKAITAYQNLVMPEALKKLKAWKKPEGFDKQCVPQSVGEDDISKNGIKKLFLYTDKNRINAEARKYKEIQSIICNVEALLNTETQKVNEYYLKLTELELNGN